MEQFDPNSPFVLTGSTEPIVPAKIALTVGTNIGDWRIVELFGDVTRGLVGAFQTARTLKVPDDEKRNAVHQLTVATAALAIAEARTLLMLVTAGFTASSRVHLRALGEYSLRVQFFKADPNTALRVYRSFVAAQVEMLKHLDADDDLTRKVHEFFAAASEKTPDQRLTGGLVKRDPGTVPIRKHEWGFWSKWSHGDILALGEVSNRILRGQGDLLERISDAGEPNFFLVRGTVFLLMILIYVGSIGIDVKESFEQFNSRLTELAREHGMLDSVTESNGDANAEN